MPSWSSHSLPGASEQGSITVPSGWRDTQCPVTPADQTKAGDTCQGSLVLLGVLREQCSCQRLLEELWNVGRTGSSPEQAGTFP